MNSYDLFKRMIDARHRAYYVYKQTLDEFVVLGSYYLDTCGNCMRAAEYCRPLSLFPNMPKVVTADEYRAMIATLPEDQQRSSYTLGSNLPPYDNVCAYCKKPWTLDTCYDLRVEKNTEIFSLENYIGKTLSKAIAKITDKKDQAIMLLGEESLIRNNKYIDLSLKPGYDTLKMNEWGWVGNDEGVTRDHIIEPGDDTYLNIWSYYHPSCMTKVIKKRLALKKKTKTYTHLPNLAGDKECDLYIKTELELANVPIVRRKISGEVPAKYAGELGKYKMWRAWTYWVVDGPVPLKIAKKMYEDPEGRKYVRVAGHCGCPAPEEWAHKGVVDTYHIDTLKGLQLFANSVRDIA